MIDICCVGKWKVNAKYKKFTFVVHIFLFDANCRPVNAFFVDECNLLDVLDCIVVCVDVNERWI